MMYEIRIHSRGGQGGVTAARLLALAAFRDGKDATACPFYGAERRGAPVVSFVRIDDRPIKVYSQIRTPDLVVVLDSSVMETVDVLQGLKEDGKILINATHEMELGDYTTYAIDLTAIALRENLVIAGSPLLNTPVLGALAKIGIVSVESVTSAISEMFSDERNVMAAKAAYEELVI
jgi:pyruvate ferredoxin oxidoreductase gamma subunit